jgi:hypothetical protein
MSDASPDKPGPKWPEEPQGAPVAAPVSQALLANAAARAAASGTRRELIAYLRLRRQH